MKAIIFCRRPVSFLSPLLPHPLFTPFESRHACVHYCSHVGHPPSAFLIKAGVPALLMVVVVVVGAEL